jgi:transcriptional regulator with XRE-family HTH domain
MNIGQRIREVREDLGMQAAVLARRTGVAPNTIYRIEAGDRTPSVALLEKIAHELRTEPADLFKEPVPLDEERTSQEWARRQGARLHGMDGETWDDYLRAHDTVEELGETWKEISDESRRLHAALRAHKRQRPQDQGRRQTLGRGLKDLRMHRYADLNASAMLLHAEALVDEIFSAMREEANA